MGSVKWESSAEANPGTKGLVWFPIEWPDSYDIISNQDNEELPPSGGDPVTLYPPAGEPDGLFEAEESRFALLQLLAEDLSKIVVVTTPSDIFVICPPDEMEVRGLLALADAWRGDTSTGESPRPIPYTVWGISVEEIMDEIQYHMEEPVIDGGQTWQYWSETEVQNYLRERVSRWLDETRFVRKRETLTINATQATYVLDPTIALLQRVYKSKRLVRMSRWELDHGNPTWQTDQAGTPDSYYEVKPGTIRLVPAPSGAGTSSYVYISTTPTEGSGDFILQTLSIPATFSWGIKYGVMADMLSREGEGNDPQRAAYCETRYADSVTLATLMLGERARK